MICWQRGWQYVRTRDETSPERSQVEAAVEPVGEDADVMRGVLAVLECVMSIGQTKGWLIVALADPIRGEVGLRLMPQAGDGGVAPRLNSVDEPAHAQASNNLHVEVAQRRQLCICLGREEDRQQDARALLVGR